MSFKFRLNLCKGNLMRLASKQRVRRNTYEGDNGCHADTFQKILIKDGFLRLFSRADEVVE